MQLQWTEDAAIDLEHITDYLLEHAPERAAQLVRTLYDAPATLLTLPQRGRPGRMEGTRELVRSRHLTTRARLSSTGSGRPGARNSPQYRTCTNQLTGFADSLATATSLPNHQYEFDSCH